MKEKNISILLQIMLGFVLIQGVASARPLIPELEGEGMKAVQKGDGGSRANFFDLDSIDPDFPRKYLRWGYRTPEFIRWFIDYQNWDRKYLSYFKRHYNEHSLTFTPSMIVMHYTVIPTAEATWGSFQRNKVSVQLMIAKDATVFQLMPLNRRCNGAYGVNHKALSIEMVARTEDDLLSRPEQVFASFCLVKYLMALYDIPLENVVAHSEVGEGVTRVPQYLDLADPYYPTRYPPWSRRTDPGNTYMRWLRTYLQAEPTQP